MADEYAQITEPAHCWCGDTVTITEQGDTWCQNNIYHDPTLPPLSSEPT